MQSKPSIVKQILNIDQQPKVTEQQLIDFIKRFKVVTKVEDFQTYGITVDTIDNLPSIDMLKSIIICHIDYQNEEEFLRNAVHLSQLPNMEKINLFLTENKDIFNAVKIKVAKFQHTQKLKPSTKK